MSKDLYEIIRVLTRKLENMNMKLESKDKQVNDLKTIVNKISARKANLEKQITEKEILIDDLTKVINERNIKNHKLERENAGYKELSRLIDLNEKVCDKFKAMFNTAKSTTQQNKQAVRELLQAIDTYELRNLEGKKFKDGDIKAFIGLLDGRCEMFNEGQCKILLNYK